MAAATSATLLPLYARAREVVLYLYDDATRSWRARTRVQLASLPLTDRDG